MAQFITKAEGIAVRFYVTFSGKKERIYLYEKGWTQEDAETAMVEYRQSKGIVRDKNITVQGYLNIFYDDYVTNGVAETTAQRYDQFIALHIVPEIGNVILVDLLPTEIQSMYSRLVAKGLSTSTVLHIHRLLHLALKYAVFWGYLKYNPCDAVKAPAQAKTTMIVPTDKEMKKILSVVKNTPLFMPVFIASTTGMRLGEVCGLQEKSVDMESSKYIIQNTLKRVNNKLLLKDTKTAKSRRPVPFLPGTAEVLKKYEKQKKESQLKAGHNYKKSEFYLKNKYGNSLEPDDISKAFKKVVRDLGMPNLKFHSLRHYHASWLLRQGVHPKVVQERLGHSTITITLDLYSHLLPDMQEAIMQKLNCTVFDLEEKSKAKTTK